MPPDPGSLGYLPGWPAGYVASPYGLLSQIAAPTLEPVTVAEAKKQCRITDSDGEPAPTVATLALASPAAPGACDNGAWRVGFTSVTADGETELGPLSAAIVVVDKTVNGQLAVSNIAIGGSAVTARRAYAIPPGGTVALFAGTLANNTATAMTLNLAASALGAQAPTVNTTLDPEMRDLITVAREWAERETERAFLTQTWTLLLEHFPWWRAPIVLPKPPLQSIISLKYYDTDNVLQTWDASNYVLVAPAGPTAQRAQIVPASTMSWPGGPSLTMTRRPDAVQVQFVCGWTSAGLVPLAIKHAMKLLIGNLWVNREAGQIVRGSADVLPFGVEALLAPYRCTVY